MSYPLTLSPSASSVTGASPADRSSPELDAGCPFSEQTLALFQELLRQEAAVRRRRAQLRALRHGRPMAVGTYCTLTARFSTSQ